MSDGSLKKHNGPLPARNMSKNAPTGTWHERVAIIARADAGLKRVFGIIRTFGN